MRNTIWDKTDHELSQELNKSSNTEIQRQTETLGRLLKIVGEAIGENKSVKVENTIRQVVGKVAVERPEWIRELKQDLTPLNKKLDYIGAAIIRKEVVREVGVKRPEWIKELFPKEVKFPEAKDFSKPTTDLLKEVLKAIESQEFDEVSVKGQVEIKEPKWLKFPDIEKPFLALAKFLKGLQEKVFKVTVENEITVKNPVKEVTVLNPQKEVKITNLSQLEKDVKLMTSQLQALGSTGSNGGGTATDTSLLSTEAKQDPLASYQLADFDADADPIYIGKVDKEGGWIIKKIEMSSGTALYSKGDSGYNWAGRTGLTYDTFDNIN